jgi:phage regulator Rha-like protein
MGELMLVEEVSGEARVSSKVISENTDRQHKNIKETIEKYHEQLSHFGKVPFQTEATESGQSEKVFYLNEDQSIFILTCLKNNEKVIGFKFNLVKAFSALKKVANEKIELKMKQAIDESCSIFENLNRVATLFGLKGNQALISANVATRKITGIDLQQTLSLELKSEDNEQFLTATQIGKELNGSPSAIKVNLLLIEHDYQGKNEAGYFPLAKGEPFAVMIDSGKKHSDGSMIQQLKWKHSIVEELKVLGEKK